MQKVTVSLDERHLYELKARQRLGEASSRSDALRRLINEYETLQQKYEDLHTRYEARRERVTQLREQVNTREERVEDLENQLQQFKAEHEDIRPRYEARGERIEQLKEQLASREQRVDELEEQLRERHDIKNEIQDLPDKIRDADTYTERRQRKLDRASVLQRIRWKVTGVPVDGDDDLGE
jgi:chromosome segregation ATPase